MEEQRGAELYGVSHAFAKINEDINNATKALSVSTLQHHLVSGVSSKALA